MSAPRPCLLCGHDLAPTELATCQPCVGSVRRDLVAIAAGFALLPGLLGRPDGASLDSVMGGLSGEAGLPGGDILAMLAPGSEHGEGLASDPPAVAFELATWCEDWASIRRETTWPVTVPLEVAWLGVRLGWALSYHPAADEFAADMARIRFRLDAATGTVDAPERGASCPYCGATLLREYGVRGRADDWSCPRCRRAFNEPQYLLALRAALEANAS